MDERIQRYDEGLQTGGIVDDATHSLQLHIQAIHTLQDELLACNEDCLRISLRILEYLITPNK